MESEKSKIASKIKALLAKTVENGCSEAEALAAIEKATELMREHQIDMTEAEIVAEGFERSIVNWKNRKSTIVRDLMANAVAQYTDTRCWRANGLTQARKVITFFGLHSDVIYASWLLEALTDFVSRKADEFIADEITKLAQKFNTTRKDVKKSCKGQLDHNHTGFMMGCARRLRQRLEAERPQQQVKAATGNALVVINKRQLVNDALKATGMRFGPARSRHLSQGGASGYLAGQAAADSASFSRGVGGGQASRFISKH